MQYVVSKETIMSAIDEGLIIDDSDEEEYDKFDKYDKFNKD